MAALEATVRTCVASDVVGLDGGASWRGARPPTGAARGGAQVRTTCTLLSRSPSSNIFDHLMLVSLLDSVESPPACFINRRLWNRTYGGVGGSPEQPGLPYPIARNTVEAVLAKVR